MLSQSTLLHLLNQLTNDRNEAEDNHGWYNGMSALKYASMIKEVLEALGLNASNN